MNELKKTRGLLACAALLASCGSSSGGSGPTPPVKAALVWGTGSWSDATWAAIPSTNPPTSPATAETNPDK